MRLCAATFVVLITASSAVAGTEVFEKWRTPAGTLHIGNRPPPGSVLLERVELAATEQRPALETAALQAPGGGLSDAARDGREIIRQRAAEREAERDRDLARDLQQRDVVESVPPVVLVSGGFSRRPHRRADGFHPRLGIGPSPVTGPFRSNIALVTPDESFRQLAPSFSPSVPFGHRHSFGGRGR